MKPEYKTLGSFLKNAINESEFIPKNTINGSHFVIYHEQPLTGTTSIYKWHYEYSRSSFIVFIDLQLIQIHTFIENSWEITLILWVPKFEIHF